MSFVRRHARWWIPGLAAVACAAAMAARLFPVPGTRSETALAGPSGAPPAPARVSPSRESGSPGTGDAWRYQDLGPREGESSEDYFLRTRGSLPSWFHPTRKKAGPWGSLSGPWKDETPIRFTSMEPAERPPLVERKPPELPAEVQPSFEAMIQAERSGNDALGGRLLWEILDSLEEMDLAARGLTREEASRQGIDVLDDNPYEGYVMSAHEDARHSFRLPGLVAAGHVSLPARGQASREEAFRILAKMPAEEIVSLLNLSPIVVEGREVPPLLIRDYIDHLARDMPEGPLSWHGYEEYRIQLGLGSEATAILLDVLRQPDSVAGGRWNAAMGLMEYSTERDAIEFLLKTVEEGRDSPGSADDRALSAMRRIADRSLLQPGDVKRLGEFFDAEVGALREDPDRDHGRARDIFNLLFLRHPWEENDFFLQVLNDASVPIQIRDKALGRLRWENPAELRALRETAEGPEEALRASALGRLSPARVVWNDEDREITFRRLLDESARVRRNAASNLGSMTLRPYEPAARAAAARLPVEPDEGVRMELLGVLQTHHALDDDEILRQVERIAASDPSEMVRRRAAHILDVHRR